MTKTEEQTEKPEKKKSQVSLAEDIFYERIIEAGLPEPVRQFRFHPTRKWPVDFAWPEHKILVEIEGGAWIHGRHTRPIGFINDMEKYNAMSEMGYTLFRFTPQMVKRGVAIETMKRILERENHNATNARTD